MDITGILIKKLALQSGSGANGTWQKQDFVIQTEEQYPKKVCFSAWAQRVDDLSRFQEGSRVKVSFDVASREYNERWYTDLRAWRIEAGDGAPAAGPAPAYNAPQSAPAPPQQTYSAPASSAGNDIDDDLPF